MWKEYTNGKQTYQQLAKKHHISIKTVQSYLDKYKPTFKQIQPKQVIVVVDAVYFQRVCVYQVVRNVLKKRENISCRLIPYETVQDFVAMITNLQQQGFVIKGIVVDGRRGIFHAFEKKIPIQMCQFHQTHIVRRYLTGNPKTEAGQHLQIIVKRVTQTDEISFRFYLMIWELMWGEFIKEKTVNPITKRWFYTHKRLRSAFRSLKTNLPYLFTFQKHNGMPNTTNSLDGLFAHLKDKVRMHRGLKLHRKKKLIEYLIVS